MNDIGYIEGLNGMGDLFNNPLSNDAPDAVELNLNQIDDFPNHPFKVRDYNAAHELEPDMGVLVDSIKRNGVLMPVIVRKKEDGRYEMISGHRRKRACEIAEISTIPAIVRPMTDDEAVIAMVDTNFQREKILPSEKAFAYKMRKEAEDHQDNNGTGRAAERYGAPQGDSARQVDRYIRLTYLEQSLLDAVDAGLLAMNAGVEISYLEPNDQKIVSNKIAETDIYPSISQAKTLRKLGNDLTADQVEKILKEEEDQPESLRDDYHESEEEKAANDFDPGLNETLQEAGNFKSSEEPKADEEESLDSEEENNNLQDYAEDPWKLTSEEIQTLKNIKQKMIEEMEIENWIEYLRELIA